MKRIIHIVIQLDENEFVLIRDKSENRINLITVETSLTDNNIKQTIVDELRNSFNIIPTSVIDFKKSNLEHDNNLHSISYVVKIGNVKVDKVKEHLLSVGSFDFEIVIDDINKINKNSKVNKYIIEEVNKFNNDSPFIQAWNSTSLKDFLDLFLPKHWKAVQSKIIESGVEFSKLEEKWLIGISDINKTMRYGSTYLETIIKSSMFVIHDCFHNLYGIPYLNNLSDDNKEFFKRVVMSGEISVLYLTEFLLASEIIKEYPYLSEVIRSRNALPLLDSNNIFGTLSNHEEIITRLELVLNKGIIEDWVYQTSESKLFFDDYIPMMGEDKKTIDLNWNVMLENNFIPNINTNGKYVKSMSSDELCKWMVSDFIHLIKLRDGVIDNEIAHIYRNRRRSLQVPENWIY